MSNLNPMQREGVIIRSTGGFYYVAANEEIFECRGRGILRAGGVTPLVGDRCLITAHENGMASLDKIMERRNYLMRPPLANLDYLFIVASVCEPAPNTIVIDRMTALAENRGIEPAIVFTKLDMADDGGLAELYRGAGFTVIQTGFGLGGIEELRELMKGRVSGFAGNTGAGKSTLLNRLCPELERETGEISRKLGRGRHTTRETQLFATSFGGYVADTPGFSSFDGDSAEKVYKDDLAYAFREFSDYVDKCRFRGCMHVGEKGCAVYEAVKAGKISESRYRSYLSLYNEVKDIKEWEIDKGAQKR